MNPYHNNYATPQLFWNNFLAYYAQELNKLDCYQCLGPFYLTDIAEKLNLKIRKAPELVSITTLSKLPNPLRIKNLYVIRLGQRHYGRASFIVCEASRNFKDEVIRLKDLFERRPDLTIPFSYEMWDRLSRLGGEALASSAALKAIHYIHDMSYMIPQYRGGNSRFRFKISGKGGEYEYWGQVEVDAVIFGKPDLVYAVEAKNFSEINDGIFKFQIAFSMQTVANKIGVKTKGVLAVRIRHRHDIIRIAFLEPVAIPNHIFTINELKIKLIADMKPFKIQ